MEGGLTMSDHYSEDYYAEDEDTFNLREWMDEFNRIRELNKSMYEYPAGWGDLIASDEQQECALSEATLETKDSGLPYNIWFDSAAKGRNARHHEMRVKIIIKDSKSTNRVSLIIPNDREVIIDGHANVKDIKGFAEIRRFLLDPDNYRLICKWWNNSFSSADKYAELEKEPDRRVVKILKDRCKYRNRKHW